MTATVQAERSPLAGFVRALLPRLPVAIFAGLLVNFWLRSEFFLTAGNVSNILRQSAPDVILASALALVVMAGGTDVVVGGIDLSIPAAAVLGVAVFAVRLEAGDQLVLALGIGAVAVVAVGLVNAFLVVVVKLTPLLATLASSIAVAGITDWVSGRRQINLENTTIIAIRDDSILGIRYPIVISLVTAAVIAFIGHRTRFGLRLQAAGGNRAAAETSGLKPSFYLAASFVLASVFAVVATLVLTARTAGYSTGLDARLLLDMVLATFIGSAFSSRRVVTVPGAVLGAILVRALGNGFQLLAVDVFQVDMIKGALILLVVASAALDDRTNS